MVVHPPNPDHSETASPNVSPSNSIESIPNFNLTVTCLSRNRNPEIITFVTAKTVHSDGQMTTQPIITCPCGHRCLLGSRGCGGVSSDCFLILTFIS